MNPIVFRRLFISHALEFIEVEAFLFVQYLKFISDPTFLTHKQTLLELVDLFLFIFIDVIEFRFFKIKLTGLILIVI